MPKPTMTKEDRKALDDAFEEYQAAAKAMHQEFVEGLSTPETVNAYITKRDAYHKLYQKFHQDLPG